MRLLPLYKHLFQGIVQPLPVSPPFPSECFSHTVLVAVPTLFLLALLPVLYIQIRTSRARPLPWTTLQSMKWLVTALMVGDKLVLLFFSIWRTVVGSHPVPTVNIVYPVFQSISMILVLMLMNSSRRAGLSNPGAIFCIWLVFLICGAPEFYAWITIGSNPSLVGQVDFVQYVCYLAFYPLLLLQLVLNCFSDPSTLCNREHFELTDTHPETSASFPNRQLLWWFGPLVSKAYKKPLDIDDLFELDDGLKSDTLMKQWETEWNKSMKASLNYRISEVELPSIVAVMWKLFKWELIGGSAIKFLSDIIQFANPAFLSLLISFTEDANAPLYEGLFYSAGLFISAMLRSFFLNNYFTVMFRVGTKIQSTLTAVVYDKTLKLSNSSRRLKTHGEIVNLMAIDVDRFRLITPQLQQYWSSPLQIVICMFLLWQTVGYAVIAGFVVMVSLIPFNICMSLISKRWTVQQMQLKDERIRITNEVLSGIKVVKLYAWEPAMESVVDEIRVKEMSLVRKAGIVKTLADMLNISAPFVVALTTFATYTLTAPDHVLTPQIAFVSLTLFNQLRGPLMMAADLISQTVQVVVSNRRLKEFLVAEELSGTAIDIDENDEYYHDAAEFSGASFAWDRDEPPQLRDISLKVGRGKLLAVVGTVGAGKSSLLLALLGEMEKLHGYVGRRGMVAYVPQLPWIRNSTLRDNIIMEKPFDKAFYEEVIEACALRADLAQLSNGDQTEIGEKGINLSGGQKARVALARAVYQDRDVYLLDDPLSAVDAHVAKHIFTNVIGPKGLLANKTRILITHGLSFLKDTDVVAVMRGGTIMYMDTYDHLLENNDALEIIQEAVKRPAEVPASESSELFQGSLKKKRRGDLIEDEKSALGRVKFSVYMAYFNSMGILRYFVPFAVTLILNSAFVMGRSLWLTDWSNDNVPGADGALAKPLAVRLGVYAILGTLEVVFLYLALTFLILGGVAASLRLHKPLFHNILRSPLSHFDVTPLGRILNRLGKDMETVDLRLSSNFRFLAVAFMSVLQTCIIISISTPLFILVIIPIFVIYLLILRYFIHCSRQLQRLTALTRSPIYSHFGETIQGATTIRAFGWIEMFRHQNIDKLEKHVRCSYLSLISNRWLSVRLEILGSTVILATALLAVLSRDWGTVTAGAIGLSVSYSLNITFMLNLLVRQVSEVETNVVAVERVKEYTETAVEAPWRRQLPPPDGWPRDGEVSFESYSTRYRPGLDLVLREVTIHISPGEKVGVVGRTGAGKSSLTLALFRIVEPAAGKILLDGVDITSIGLHDLRERLTIIPQDPVLFSGTLRFNLDPTSKYSDAELWTALELANLKPFVEGLPLGLHHQIDESGENISVGQRQLVCLTRALLRKSKVLVLDEATAAVDTHTDTLIQATIRKQFDQSTVITIAHRLNTILDYDRVLVMDNGRVVEFAPPQQLLADKNSIFHSMASSANLN
ncbi:putative multi drug resistance-associated protein [Teladorsagia circumcincta]|uniref:ABC-type glutathione-S-conjugate transporter n=2 Tax=Teladorsagia circumcincta TaxID=45464 RepID=A0A2G9V4X4_TELCI|nr:putative multi drug resistance-associated protein [Teladorsagia circumcincta]